MVAHVHDLYERAAKVEEKFADAAGDDSFDLPSDPPVSDVTTPSIDPWPVKQTLEEDVDASFLPHFVWLLLYTFGAFLAVCVVLLLVIKLVSIWNTRKWFRRWQFNLLSHPPVVVGFFHPYCNAGGGGERVLWQSIRALQSRYNFIKCIVYTGDKATKSAICSKVKDRFGIDLSQDVEFIFLKGRGWVEAGRWPRFTLLGQGIGSIILGLEAFGKFVPDVYIDTMGYAFTMPLFRWLGRCRTASYVHYPVVSQDMLQVVQGGVNTFNNARWISRSRFLTKCKVLYYKLFARLYGFVGRRSSVVMVNSTWTHRHISKLWKCRRLFIVYPPCDTSTFQQLPIARPGKNFTIISVGQFRPEKNHELQLEVLKTFLSYIDNARRKTVKLVLVGSCRNREDEDRVFSLRKKAESMGITKHVDFKTNISFEMLQNELKNATVALHTMENEHFGIVLPECMAAGCVMVAHNSGGPKEDIVVDWQGNKVGYLGDSPENMASCLVEILNFQDMERRTMVMAARESVSAKFSVSVFEASFLRATEDLFG